MRYVISATSFCFNDTATTEIYTYGHTLSLHDALPICVPSELSVNPNAQGLGGFILSVHNEDAGRRATKTGKPSHQLIGVRMGGQHREVVDFGMNGKPRSVDLDLSCALHHGAAARSRGLKAGKQDGELGRAPV